MEERGAHYYKIKVDSSYQSGQDLVISVKGVDSRSDPDLYISSTNEQPTNRDNSEYACAFVGEDICTIPSSALSPGKVFYISTKCYRKCGYSLGAEFLTEIPIKNRKDYKINLNAGDKRIYTFHNIHEGVKDIYITARSTGNPAQMRMFIKEGEDGIPNTSDFKSSDGWDNGIVLKLTNQTLVKVSQNATYKILLETDDAVTANLRIDLLYQDKIITEGNIYDDFVYSRDKSCYKYLVKSSDKKLRIGAYSFSGNPDIYVTPESDFGDDLTDFKFKATEASDDVLVLTPQDRLDIGQKKGWYHICITAKTATSYRLRVVESNESYFLEDGIAETNEIRSGTDLSFYYTDVALIRDLNITFTLATHSGPTPSMTAKFCGRVSEDQCSINSPDSPGVIKSVNEHGELYSFIKHVGKECAKTAGVQTTPCLFVINVSSPRTIFEKVSHFSLVAHHNETSYIKLREGIEMNDMVENQQMKYFRFVNRDSTAQNITFTLTSHHGDADMYVSTVDKYPDSKNFEKKSQKSSRFADEVIFSNTGNKGSLLGVYYIGVKGFDYSAYSLRATINREGDGVNKTLVPIFIREGVSHNAILHGKDDRKLFKFRTDMQGEDESDIRISLTASTGDYMMYVKQDGIPDTDNYDYVSYDASEIIMHTSQSNYKGKGNKYVLVVPSTRYGTFPKQGRFSIKYTLEHSVQNIFTDIPVHGNVKIGNYSYFRFQSLEKVDELTISLTPLSGEADLVASSNPENTAPTLAKNNFSSRQTGKDSVTISGKDLWTTNPSCNPRDLAITGATPCELFIGVYCRDSTDSISSRSNDSCSFTLKVYTQFGSSHLIHDGIPQKDHVKETQILSYYMPLDTTREDLYITANAELGDIKVYVAFADHETKTSDIMMPTKEEHIRESKEIGHSQMIHFTRKDLRKECDEFNECMLLISVQGVGGVQFNEYSLTAYYHMRRLIKNSPTIAVVEGGGMTYFSYKSFCDDCTIFLSAAPFAVDADIDLYLNIGAEKDLPTPDAYDIKKTEWFTEHIELDTQHEYFIDNDITTMQNTILIGIYAKETAIVYIDAEETSSRLKALTHGKGVIIDQEPNSQVMFQYSHKGDADIKFELTGLHSEVDVRVNCYNPDELDRPMNAYIPIDTRTSKWEANSKQDTSIVIENEEEEFCEGGVYLITITSTQKGAKYTLEVQRGNAFTTKQIRVGIPIKDQITDGHEKQYVFALDKKKPFRVTTSVYSGHVSYSIGTKKDFSRPIMTSDEGDLIIDEFDIKKFETGENVYIRVVGEFDHSEFILLVTHDDSYSIIPDSYTQIFGVDPRDDKGIRLMYYPPASEHQLKVQVNGFSDGLQFFVLKKQVYLKDIKKGKLQFPYPQSYQHQSGELEWDRDQRQYVKTEKVNPQNDDPYVYLISIIPIVHNEDELENRDKVKVSVNINSHPMNILTANIPLEETLSTELGDYAYFKFFANGRRDIEINLIPCVCMTEMFVFKSYENALAHSNTIARSHQMVNGMKKITLEKADGPYFIMVRNDVVADWDETRKASDYCAFQIEYYDKSRPDYKYSIDQYYPQNDGVIEYDWPKHGHLHLKWGKILKENNFGTEEFFVIGKMYAFREKSIFTNSMCGLKHHIKRFPPLYTEEAMYAIERTYNINEMSEFQNEKYVTFNFHAAVNRDGGAVMYQPVTVAMNISWFGGIPWFLIISVITVIAVLGYAVYYFKNKADDTQSKLDFEMNDIRNVARVPYADDGVEEQQLT